MRNPFEIVERFEEAVAEYTAAPYAIACDSCTDAIFLCCKHCEVQGSTITIPSKTYISPPQSILQAGAKLKFEDIKWSGIYHRPTQPKLGHNLLSSKAPTTTTTQ